MRKRFNSIIIGLLAIVASSTPVVAAQGDTTTFADSNDGISDPTSLTVNPMTGDVYITNAGNNTISKLDSNGTATTIATSADGISRPWAIEFDPTTGNLFVANQDIDTISKIDANGTVTTIATGANGIDRPWALAVNHTTGDVYVVNQGIDTISKIDNTGTVTSVANSSDGIDNPWSIVANQGTGDVYVLLNANNTILTISPDDTVSALVQSDTKINRPLDLAFDAAAQVLYVVNSGGANPNNASVSTVDLSGVTTTVATAADGIDFPVSVAVNSATGDVYIANAGDETITKIDNTGTVSTVASTHGDAKGIAIDPVTKHVYTTDYRDDYVHRIEGVDPFDPTVAIASPTNGTSVISDTTLTANYTCADTGGAGLNTCTATLNGSPITNGTTINTTTRGTYTLAVTATDRSSNITTETVMFTIYGQRELIGPYANLSGSDASLARLYMAVFARQPDAAGQQYWVSQVESGVTLLDIADFFVNSPEFIVTYNSLNNQQFAELLYVNVMNRGGDQEGITYWTSILDSGVRRAHVLVLFSDSAEFMNLTRTT